MYLECTKAICTQLILLQKTLLAVEGLGRQLYPEFDLWETAQPFLEKWLRKQMGPSVLLQQLRANLPFFIEQLPHMPRLLNDVLLLNKEQQLASLEKQALESSSPITRNAHYKGMGLALLISMTIIGSMNYFHFISNEKLSIIAFGTAFIGGLLAIINWRR